MRSSTRYIEDLRWMGRAFTLAKVAEAQDEVPVGAVVIKNSAVLAEGHNLTRSTRDPTAHAELLTIRAAAVALSDWRLTGCTLYVTLEPCAMCAGALVLSRISRLVFAARDPKSGMAGSLENLVQEPRLNHQLEVTGGVLADASGELLQDFFRIRRT